MAEEIRQLALTKSRLDKITKGCRYDMNEPEQLKVLVIGDHLNNSYGTKRTKTDMFGTQEFIVLIQRDNKEEAFNLADLIALARQSNY